MKSELNSSIITEANKVLTATSVAKISLINNDEGTQAPYFANVLSNQSIYHSFNIQMIRSNSANSSTDIIHSSAFISFLVSIVSFSQADKKNKDKENNTGAIFLDSLILKFPSGFRYKLFVLSFIIVIENLVFLCFR